ncbi:DPF2 [Cordylochernes scorpioides]|uniref:DPF2 n=1 Tax=Cordylochernes scorpioides TaxID=51811 RepID=A0ABY6L8S0_9ARAC|nr:DPF2 [Cordylochernes scorpioides]
MLDNNTDSIERLKRFLADSIYQDAIKNSSKYNTRICLERKQRLPFLDAQTGVAQSDCALWMAKWQRMPGCMEGQLYSYPAKRWRKKRRQYLLNDSYFPNYAKDAAPSEQDLHSISVMENSAAVAPEQTVELENGGEKVAPPVEDSKDSWYKDYDESMDMPELPEPEDPETEGDDYEETYLKKKKKKSKTSRPKKKEMPVDEKPYVCEICSMRYKTRPGLSYHYAHSHTNGTTDNDDFGGSSTPASARAGPADKSLPPPPTTSSSDDALAGLQKFQASFLTLLKTPPANGQKTPPATTNSPSTPTPPAPPSNGKQSGNAYCDFCLGDNGENKKTQQPEELVTCSDCGRAAHPSCLQFTPNMTASVKKYKWQCIECKSCGLCGTSDNDDQLLFCDDCDRGYHMYCLSPPLSEPPEGKFVPPHLSTLVVSHTVHVAYTGSWSCHLCIVEYHGGIKK